MESFTQRMVAAYAVGAQAFALGLLARGAVRTPLQYLALVWGVLFAVAFGWAWLPPDFPAPWLHRLVVTVAALAVVVVVYGFGLVKFLQRENEWTRAAARLVPPLAVLAVALILVVLAMEVLGVCCRRAACRSRPRQCSSVGLALAGLAVGGAGGRAGAGPRSARASASAAARCTCMRPKALAALLFLHIRVTMPWLFQRLVPAVLAAGGDGDRVCRRRAGRIVSAPPAARALRAAAKRRARCCRCCRRSVSG